VSEEQICFIGGAYSVDYICTERCVQLSI